MMSCYQHNEMIARNGPPVFAGSAQPTGLETSVIASSGILAPVAIVLHGAVTITCAVMVEKMRKSAAIHLIYPLDAC
jgi:hypothetical protein